MPDKGLLHGMQLLTMSQPFNSKHIILIVNDGQAQARVNPPSIDLHRTGAALTMIATFLCASETNTLPDDIQKGGPWIDAFEVITYSIYLQLQVDGIFAA